MIDTEPRPLFSSSSLLCRHVLPSTVIASSHDAGWKSILLDHHRVYPTDQEFETAPTPDHTIVVMTQGEQTIESFRAGTWRQAVYRAGTVGMTPGGLTDRLRRRVKRKPLPFEKINLYIPQEFFHEAADHYRKAGQRFCERPLLALAFHDPLIAQTVYSMSRAAIIGAPDLYAQMATQWLAVHLLSARGTWLDLAEDRPMPGVISDTRLAGVIEYMSARFAEPLMLENLAAEAGVSKFHFATLFRKRVGETPHAYLTQLRMAAARSMLATSDLTVAEVATQCGFARPAHFGNAFTKRFGLSPTAFRNRSRR